MSKMGRFQFQSTFVTEPERVGINEGRLLRKEGSTTSPKLSQYDTDQMIGTDLLIRSLAVPYDNSRYDRGKR